MDDLLLASTSRAAIDSVKQHLSAHFKLRDLGPVKFFLGVKVERNRKKRTLQLSQQQYINDMLKRYDFDNCHPVSTPLNSSVSLTKEDGPKTAEELETMRHVPYIHAVGSLIYLALSTRPDIAHAVSVLARFNSNPGWKHWMAVKHLFRYLKGTIDYKLTYSPQESETELFTTYSDADHGGNKDNGRSTSAFVVKMGGGAISWSSKQQTGVAKSTCEAEYISANTAGSEVVWLRNLFTELGYDLTKKTSTLFVDNQSAIQVAKNPEHHGRMKHLDLALYWLRDAVNKGIINIKYCPTASMPADLLTKSLERIKVASGVEMLGLRK